MRGHLVKLLVGMVAISLIILSGCTQQESKEKVKTSDIMGNTIKKQRQADEKIEKAMKDKRYTLSEPFVLKNPYVIAPQTAIIIFNTEDPTTIKMNINGTHAADFESSTVHALPVYGLYDDYTNKVELTDEKGTKSEVTIKMPKYEGEVLSVEKTGKGLSDEFFLVSPDYENTSIYDKNGKLLWYLDTGDNEGAVVFLDDGNFLISDPYQGTGGIRINYSGFLEMDYLGKIHKQYIGEYGYHHEIEPINDGKDFLISGNKDDSPFLQAVVYIVDGKTMKIKKSIDLYEIFSDIAPDWVESLGEPFNMVINGINFDEKSGDVLISIRATGMVTRINMDSGEIKWIFADPASMPDEFKKYLLRPVDGTRYPYGQHAAMFMPDGTIAYHNNDIDIIKDVDQHLSNFLDRYSSNEIIRVDEDAKTVKTEWTYDGDKKIFSKMSGSLEFRDDGHKLLSYGSAVKKEAYKNPKTAEITDNQYTNGLMLELDENDKVLWRATFPGVMHKVYKSRFYRGGDVERNYSVDKYVKIDGQDQKKHVGKEVEAGEMDSKIKGAESFSDKVGGSFDLLINRAVVDCEYDEKTEIKIFFSDEDGGGRLFTYKKKGEMPRIINSGRYGIQVAGLKGKYRVYVSLDGTWYDTYKEFVLE